MKSIDYNRLAIETAELSPCKKRKVGAVIVAGAGLTIVGFNEPIKLNGPCELPNGETHPDVIHAEIKAIENFIIKTGEFPIGATIYVTHQPCANCAKAIQDAGIKKVIIVEQFMKFDSEKLRYELIPPSALEALAKVLTYGARKYKAENWRKGEINRYTGATFRHLEAWRRGEDIDKESGFLHLELLLTNVAFLLELTKNKHDIDA